MSKSTKKIKLGFWISTPNAQRLERAATAAGYETLSAWIRRAVIDEAGRVEARKKATA